MAVNVYDIVTDRIIKELEKGNIPWHKPWIRPTTKYKTIKVEINPNECAYSRTTGKPYSFLNQMLLGIAGEWATYKQITEAGGKVRKGEKASVCVFWKFNEVKTGKFNPDGSEIIEQVPCLRYYNVFHVATQCEDIKPKTRKVFTEETIADGKENTYEWDAIEAADEIVRQYIERTGITIKEQIGDRAFYTPAFDSITTPARSQFRDPAEFYSTLFHEMTHSTGHRTRLNRFCDAAQFKFGSESYSKEELVAELGAAAMNNMLGIENKDTFRNSAAYIQSWVSALKNDNKLIVSASSRAEKAVNYILSGEIA
jgi:antirestriction protein ArdC